MNLSLAFVDNAEIQTVNRKFLRQDCPTDVIAFLLDGPDGGDPIHGEIVISAEYALGEAKKRRIDPQEELLRYVVHGILHLCGYDDRTPRLKRRMWTRQESYLGKFLRRRYPSSPKYRLSSSSGTWMRVGTRKGSPQR